MNEEVRGVFLSLQSFSHVLVEGFDGGGGGEEMVFLVSDEGGEGSIVLSPRLIVSLWVGVAARK